MVKEQKRAKNSVLRHYKKDLNTDPSGKRTAHAEEYIQALENVENIIKS